MNDDTRHKLQGRMSRIAGQVAAVSRMVEQDTDCVDTLMQISAVQGALGKVGELVLKQHIQSCVAIAFASGDDSERDRKIEELVSVFAKYARR